LNFIQTNIEVKRNILTDEHNSKMQEPPTETGCVEVPFWWFLVQNSRRRSTTKENDAWKKVLFHKHLRNLEHNDSRKSKDVDINSLIYKFMNFDPTNRTNM
jgi:hypothetical protein